MINLAVVDFEIVLGALRALPIAVMKSPTEKPKAGTGMIAIGKVRRRIE